MKKRTRIIIFLGFLLVLFLGWLLAENKIESKMRDALIARYPTDTFTVRDVSLTIIPPGAKAVAHAEHAKLDFTVSLVRDIGKPAEIRDDFYEAKSLKYYKEIFASKMKAFGHSIEGYYIEPIVLGERSRDKETGNYPCSVEILLNRDIRDLDSFLAAVKKIGTDLKADHVKGVDGYTFMSFPGSVPEDDLGELGLRAAWLTAPTPTPTPSPTPRPTTIGTGTSDTTTPPTTTKATTTVMTETAEDKGLRPAFAYELTILTDDFNLNDDLLKNACRTLTYSVKDLKRIAEHFGLDEQASRLLNNAPERQEGAGHDKGFDKPVTGKTE